MISIKKRKINRDSNNKIISFPDIIIENILNYYIITNNNKDNDKNYKYEFEEKDEIENNNILVLDQVYYLLSVSSQFFKVLSKIINQKISTDNTFRFNWCANIFNYNNKNHLNFINKAPLYLNACDLESKLNGRELCPTIETFEINEANISSFESLKIPNLPSLKNLIITGHYGCKFIEESQSIVNSDSHKYYKNLIKNIKRCGTGIENFKIRIRYSKKDLISPVRKSVEIFKTLLKYHQKSLQSITINFQHPRPLRDLIYKINDYYQFYNGEEFDYAKRFKKYSKIIKFNISINNEPIDSFLDCYFKKKLEDDEYKLLVLLFIKNQNKILNLNNCGNKEGKTDDKEDEENEEDEEDVEFSDSCEDNLNDECNEGEEGDEDEE